MRTVTLFVLLSGALSAQSPGDPLTLIRIVRSESGPASRTEVYRQANPAIEVTGMKSITGSSQVWFVEALGSFEALEEMDKALPESGRADTDSGAVSLLAVFRHGLSYRPEEAIKLMPRARYLQASIYRTRPGFDLDLAELIRLRRAALDNINADRPELGYQVISGDTNGTYIFLAPLASLKVLDQVLSNWQVRADAGAAAGGKARHEIAAEAEITRQHFLFRIERGWGWSPERQ